MKISKMTVGSLALGAVAAGIYAYKREFIKAYVQRLMAHLVTPQRMASGVDTFSAEGHPKVESPNRFGDNVHSVGPDMEVGHRSF